MQAYRQNTRQLAALQSETLEWSCYGHEWSLVNFGPGTLWFNYSGRPAAVGDIESTELRSGFSFTNSQSGNRFMEISLQADEPLTYTLTTNQRYDGRAAIGEAPLDGFSYVRRQADWQRLSGPAISLGLAPNWTGFLTYRLAGGGIFLEIAGTIERLAGNDIAPGVAALIATLPEGVRPAMAIQYAPTVAANRAQVGVPIMASLNLQSNGNLSVFVAQAANVIYIAQLFDLTLV